MQRMSCTFLELTLGVVTLLTPIFATACPQAENRRAEQRRDAVERQLIYDRDRKDYHRWNENEDRAYRQYWQGRHRAYREYARLNRREQSHYWSWRHSHPDHDGGN